VTLRVDDRPPLVIKDARAYQLLWELVDRIEAIEAVREGLEQVEEGRTLPLEELDRRLRKKHGIRG
jgi:predicted transcriptional regulator